MWFIRLRDFGAEKQLVLINLKDCLWSLLCGIKGPCSLFNLVCGLSPSAVSFTVLQIKVFFPKKLKGE